VSEDAGIESKTEALTVRCSEQLAKNIIKLFFDRRSRIWINFNYVNIRSLLNVHEPLI
jgi:hypothetical protein